MIAGDNAVKAQLSGATVDTTAAGVDRAGDTDTTVENDEMVDGGMEASEIDQKLDGAGKIKFGIHDYLVVGTNRETDSRWRPLSRVTDDDNNLIRRGRSHDIRRTDGKLSGACMRTARTGLATANNGKQVAVDIPRSAGPHCVELTGEKPHVGDHGSRLNSEKLDGRRTRNNPWCRLERPELESRTP